MLNTEGLKEDDFECLKEDDFEFQSSQIDVDKLKQSYKLDSKHPCLICGDVHGIVGVQKKLPIVPICRACKRDFFHHNDNWSPDRITRNCPKGGMIMLCFLMYYASLFS